MIRLILIILLLTASYGMAADQFSIGDMYVEFNDDFIGYRKTELTNIWYPVLNTGISNAVNLQTTKHQIQMVAGTNARSTVYFSSKITMGNFTNQPITIQSRVKLMNTNNSIYRVNLMHINTTNRLCFVCSNSATRGIWKLESVRGSGTNRIARISTGVTNQLNTYVSLKLIWQKTKALAYINNVYKCQTALTNKLLKSGEFEYIPMYIQTISGGASKVGWADYTYYFGKRY